MRGRDLRGGEENWLRRNLLKSMKVIQVRKSSNEGKESELAISCSQAQFSVVRLGCVQLNCQPREFCRDSQITQDGNREDSCTPQSDSRASLQTTTQYSSLSLGRSSWCLLKAFTPMFQSFWCKKVFYRLLKENRVHQPSPKTYVN